MTDRLAHVVACALVGVLGVAAGWSFTVAFAPGDLVVPVVAAATGAVAVAVVLELVGLRSAVVAVATSAAAWLGFVVVVVLPGAEGGVLRGLGVGVVDGWARIASSTVPTPDEPELRLVPATATWLAVAVGCELARRTRSSMLPALPAVILLGVGLLFGIDRQGPGLGVVAVVAALVGMLAVVREWATESAGEDGLVSPTDGTRRLLLAVPVIVVLALLAGVVGPRLPGVAGRTAYDLRAVVDEPLRQPVAVNPFDRLAPSYLDDPATEGDDRDEVRLVVRSDEPLPRWTDVDVRPDGTSVDLVRVTAATFDRYDGTTWEVAEDHITAGAQLPPAGLPADAPLRRATVTFEVGSLDGPWLPTVGRAEALRWRTDARDVQVDPTTGSLVVPTGLEGGEAYELDVVVPPPLTEVAPTPGLPADDGESLQVVVSDADLTPQLQRVAVVAEAVAGAERGDYPALIAALQALFHGRLGEVRGPLTGELAEWDVFEFLGPEALAQGGDGEERVVAPTGHSLARVLELLYTPLPGRDDPSRRAGRGTPEQFATAFVVLARSLGVPARVAVGWSVPVPAGEQVREVRALARHADAWPEVWSAEHGWVAVDVTPIDAGALPDEPEPTTTSTLPPTTDAADVTAPPVATTVIEPDGRGGGGGPLGLLVRLVVVLAVVVLVGLGVPALVRARRRARRRRAATAAEQISGAWDDVLDTLAAHGVVARPGMTVSEVIELTGRRLGPQPAETTAIVGRCLERATCAERQPGEHLVEEAWSSAGRLRRQVAHQVTPVERLRAALDLRPEVRRLRVARRDARELWRPSTPAPPSADEVIPELATAPDGPAAVDDPSATTSRRPVGAGVR